MVVFLGASRRPTRLPDAARDVVRADDRCLVARRWLRIRPKSRGVWSTGSISRTSRRPTGLTSSNRPTDFHRRIASSRPTSMSSADPTVTGVFGSTSWAARSPTAPVPRSCCPPRSIRDSTSPATFGRPDSRTPPPGSRSASSMAIFSIVRTPRACRMPWKRRPSIASSPRRSAPPMPGRIWWSTSTPPVPSVAWSARIFDSSSRCRSCNRDSTRDRRDVVPRDTSRASRMSVARSGSTDSRSGNCPGSTSGPWPMPASCACPRRWIFESPSTTRSIRFRP